MLRKRSGTFSESNHKKQRVLRDTNVLRDTTNITPPVTPTKKRIVEFDIKQDDDAVKKLFPSPPATPTKSNKHTDPITKPTPKASTKTNVYSQTKSIFQRGYGNQSFHNCLIGRESEGAFINSFFKSNIVNGTCDSMYVSGPPGSGKSAQLDMSLGCITKNDMVVIGQKRCKLIKLNCMILMNPAEVFNQVCSELGTSSSLYETLVDGVKGVDSVLVVLDEIDSLLTSNQEVLFELFRLSSAKYTDKLRTKLVLVGIANSLDLTDKLLPKLESTGLHPKLVAFKPYTFDKMKAIVTSKLRGLIETEKENIEANFVPIINSSAILLCCKKISSTTGDLRKCFDVLYKSIEVLEQELKSKEPQNLPTYDIMTAPKVTISQVAKVCNLDYGGNILSKLTYIQRIIIVYLLKLESDCTFKGKANLTTFYDYYKKTELSSTKLSKVRMSEFIEILSNLESLSLVTLSKTNNISMKLVQSNLNYTDFKKSINNIDQLRHLL